MSDEAIGGTQRLPLPVAAMRLGGYIRAWRLLTAGRLDSVRHDGRWYVTQESVAREHAAMAGAGNS